MVRCRMVPESRLRMVSRGGFSAGRSSVKSADRVKGGGTCGWRTLHPRCVRAYPIRLPSYQRALPGRR